MVCWAAIVWWFDRYEKEPFSLLIMAFSWGVAPAVAISLALELILPSSTAGSHGSGQSLGLVLLETGAWAPWIEEGIKLLGLAGVFMAARNEIDGPLDGIIYAAMIGFGFAATENTLYFLTSSNLSDFFLLFFLRAMVFGSAHAMFTALSGWGLVMARFSKRWFKSVVWVSGGYLLAVSVHWIHNEGIRLAAENPWPFFLSVAVNLAGMLFVVFLLSGSLLRERNCIRRFLFHYVREGIISPAQWTTASSVRARISIEWEALRKWDIRGYRRLSNFYSLCAEISFKEKQRALNGPDPMLESRIFWLRQQLAERSKGAGFIEYSHLV